MKSAKEGNTTRSNFGLLRCPPLLRSAYRRSWPDGGLPVAVYVQYGLLIGSGEISGCIHWLRWPPKVCALSWTCINLQLDPTSLTLVTE